ncbi:hypothetical protein LOZ53_005321 [Ophidiomyces ophidiicola]|uniref:Uncharacterized protein n=1 Tax=Ophidiomyces ophidiicola TaxID=1387563 RepID=A0ACB8UX22_9EURO|nr:uncharacterized protein LOZ57_004490 [Ophidiomyces ophidiicola]KAI1907354.1 hypothetical protein LOZ64_005916 [Ophidiomyces ophidiicola]KAI1909750.1 hypothetical protein LOZ61_004812 [Ophidiomyces ophidiicola]KAI1924647.1 hypothetical protein LOZ60_004567 [Ophidiomyces ophidiicola]KAI1945191.1 hypothetical protein LOZ57_004490 [Ophidiomyces ophidiicola]KAI1946601.1 hypothetical protein LOZ62_003318 [Ophidiomyces ophidiicola]
MPVSSAQVTFGTDTTRRRRSSWVSADVARSALRQTDQPSNAACFVHSLLGKPKELHLQPLKENNIHEALPDAIDHDDAVLESRLLTKKQLSDMAWNVRTLSKKLGNIRLKLNVHSVFLLTKPQDDCLVRLTRDVARWLLSKDRNVKYVVYIEKRLKNEPDFDEANIFAEEPSANGRLEYWDTDLIRENPQLIDFIITLGGDGTVLYASWLFQHIVPPVLSFSLGSLGFLTKFDFGTYKDTLRKSFEEGVTLSLRLRFECTVMRSKSNYSANSSLVQRDVAEQVPGDETQDKATHVPDKTFHILNEIVVDRGPNPTMSSLEIFGDDEYFTSIQADGVCVATPTGSTAYNLAAGGSLCHPENPVILLTAICAHTLNFRPVILPDTIVLRIGVAYDARTSSWASFDGRERMELLPGDYVTVSASRFPFANVMTSNNRSGDWIESISRTLNWNTREKQKPTRHENYCDSPSK